MASVGGVITTGSFPKELFPGLKAIWDSETVERQRFHDRLYETMTSRQKYEDIVQEVTLGAAIEKPEGQPTTYDSEFQGFTTRFTHVAYSLGFMITQEAMRDNLYKKQGNSRTRSLGNSFYQTKETVGADMYNNAFTRLCGDGTAIIGASHPLGIGGTYSNTLPVAADLSELALEDLRIAMSQAVDDRGLLAPLQPGALIIAPQNEFNAHRILKSTFQSGTANNDINALKSLNLYQDIVVNPYLLNPNAYFVRTKVPKERGCIMFQRDPLEFGQDKDFNTANSRFKGYERYSFGIVDPRSLWGVNGP